MDAIKPLGTAAPILADQILAQNTAAAEDLPTRSKNGSGLPTPIQYRCFERMNAKVLAR